MLVAETVFRAAQRGPTEDGHLWTRRVSELNRHGAQVTAPKKTGSKQVEQEAKSSLELAVDASQVLSVRTARLKETCSRASQKWMGSCGFDIGPSSSYAKCSSITIVKPPCHDERGLKPQQRSENINKHLQEHQKDYVVAHRPDIHMITQQNAPSSLDPREARAGRGEYDFRDFQGSKRRNFVLPRARAPQLPGPQRG